jgi:hypothetical protein
LCPVLRSFLSAFPSSLCVFAFFFIFVGYFTTSSVAKLCSVKGWVEKWMVNWKWFGGKRSWTKLGYCLLRET